MRTRPRTSTSDNGTPIEALYSKFVHLFYEAGDLRGARKVAPELEALLESDPDLAASIRGEEIRSLLAELRGDLLEAIRSREAEIRKILELHALAMRSASWSCVSRQYDHGDVSDRLDLLAILYDRAGDQSRAKATLLESKNYCLSHGIAFDGQALLTELEQASLSRRTVRRKSQSKAKRQPSPRVRAKAESTK